MRIKLSRGATINMGNYQSYRFDVGVELDFDPEKISVDAAYNATAIKLSKMFIEEVEESRKQKSLGS